MRGPFLLFLVIILTSCAAPRIPMPVGFYGGVFQSCRTDSTTLTADTLIQLKTQKVCDRCPENKYLYCGNLPEYIDVLQMWPSSIILNFKEKHFLFLYSNRPFDLTIKYGDNKFSVAYNHDLGTLKYNKKLHLLTLTSTKYNWTRTFIMTYSKTDDILTLRAKTTPKSAQ